MGKKKINQITSTLTKPTDTKDYTKISLVFFDQDVMNSISNICQPVAGGSEFQVHYRALIIRGISKVGEELVISIPTVFYNFKQSVTTGSVNYHLDDILEAAELVKEESQAKAQEILQKAPLLQNLGQLFESYNIYESNSGSIHRHPGRFSFSNIDKNNDPSSPGVIYRNRTAENHIQTDSVIFLGSDTEVYTTETFVVNVQPSEDGGVAGTYCEVPTISAVRIRPNTMLESVLGTKSVMSNEIYKHFNFKTTMGFTMGEYEILTEVLKVLNTLEYTPSIEAVHSEHISQNAFIGKVTSSLGLGKLSGYNIYGDEDEGMCVSIPRDLEDEYEDDIPWYKSKTARYHKQSTLYEEEEPLYSPLEENRMDTISEEELIMMQENLKRKHNE